MIYMQCIELLQFQRQLRVSDCDISLANLRSLSILLLNNKFDKKNHLIPNFVN